jgi:DNA polymerase IV
VWRAAWPARAGAERRLPAATGKGAGGRDGGAAQAVGARTYPRYVSRRRVIAHVDIDAFYASVELQRRPELRGKPVIVSGSGPRAVVTTASYEARRFGVHSAMPTSRARRLCPDAILIPPDFEAYRAASKRVWDIVRREIEVVEQLGLDEAYLDLSAFVAPKATMRRLVSEILAETGLTASVGIGPNRLVAKVASDCEKPSGLVALSREMACERFAGAPPKLLPGIGPKTAARLDEMGIRTLAELRAADPKMLAERFGDNLGRYLSRRANFEDDGVVQRERAAAVSRSNETTFDYDVDDMAELERVLQRLTDRLCDGLKARGRTIGIKVRLADFTTVTRARTIDQPTNDEAVIGAIALELLRAYAPPKPVRLLGVRIASFVEDGDSEQLRLAL